MNRNKLRIIASLIIAAAIVAVMAACGRVEDPAGNNDPTGTDSSVTVPATDLPETTIHTEATTDDTQPVTEMPEQTEPATEPTVTEPTVTEPTVTEPAETEPEASEPEAQADYSKIVDTATDMLGVPYASGGSSPEDGFDTSGFTYYCVRAAGIDFPRSLKDQLESGERIPYSELRAGDIVYFAAEEGGEASFCGVYVGGGLMIYSPVPDDFVKTANITTNYWTTHFVTGLRVSAES